MSLIAALLSVGLPSLALPKFARQYGVDCHQCHQVPPRLNEFGLAFQANHFNWPGSKPPPRNDHVARFPVSGMATYSYENNRTDRTSQANFRALELFLTDGYRTSEQQSGGFFVNAIAVTTEKGVRDWGLDNAFVSLPVAGRRGQWALTLGQFTPLMFQWDPVNSLTESLPAAMADDLNGFSLAQATPGIRLDFFDNRGKLTAGQTVGADRQGGMSGMGKPGAAGMGGMGKSGAAGMGGMGKPGAAGMGGMGAPNAGGMEMAEMEYKGAADGNYLSIGVPFNGALALNRDAKLGGAQGAYLHGFRRWGFTTLGFFGYTRTGSNLEGLVGTREVRKDLTILAAASTGHDDQGSTHRLSMQADYVISHQLSVSGRLEVLGGQRSDVAPVLSATYYPYEKPWMWLRVTGEMVQRKGDRTLSLLVRALF